MIAGAGCPLDVGGGRRPGRAIVSRGIRWRGLDGIVAGGDEFGKSH